MKTWCMLCLGLHHYNEYPPVMAGTILPYFMNNGCLLWAIEWPTHPLTIWVKAKSNVLKTAFPVVQAINKVDNKAIDNAASHPHNGSNKCLTLSKIFSYSCPSLDGCDVETIGKDFKIFSACSEWRHLHKYNLYLKYSVKSFLSFFIFSIKSNPPGCLWEYSVASYSTPL